MEQLSATPNTITYLVTKKSSLMPWGFVGLGSLLAIFGLVFMIVLLFLVPPAAIFPCAFVVFALGFAAYGGWMLTANRKHKLVLTDKELVSISGNNTLRLTLVAITAVDVREGTYWYEDPLRKMMTQGRYWYVRIETGTGDYLHLDITQDGYFGLFDVSRVLRDLLPRLPSGVYVDPRIGSYLTSGRMQ